jgi:serine/threonine-protein kinase
MDERIEERVLKLAMAEGLLSSEELAEQTRDVERWGPRLAGVLRSGLLEVDLAERLIGEASSMEAPAAASPENGNGHAHGEERFQIGAPLGEGGMGKVYRCYDAALRRQVALKLLKSDDPDRLARFLREAQAQARVDHENVCKIYEVGELEGKPYIAMQLIEGQPLYVTDGEESRPSPMLAEMTVDQKARLMQKVAEAIHAAHREGLIHRDIKPSNIMLANEHGAWKPYVLDFGLAREVASAGVTSLGLAAGTPNFMAPEQARGEAAALDRRTDVYGLGATLYAVLAGSPPFEGPSSLDVLVQVTQQDAPPLTGVPADLATIVAKCLQKEPAQRYESARSLAEDLGRYLSGDPIHARRTSLLERLVKRARKHRKLVAAGAAVSLAFLALAGWSLEAQLQARRQAQMAGVFGQEVKAIESRMQVAHLLPEHDIRGEKAAILQRMAAIEEQMRTMGSVAVGPGHYALGRGHLALGELDAAREHLQQAWDGGYRVKEVAYALGQTLGSLYQRELEAAERISDKARREARTAVLQSELRDPALRALEASRGLELESPEYAEALVALYERRYEQAIAKAQAAYAHQPWLYEAHLAEATAYTALSRSEVDHTRYEQGRQFQRRAEEAYASAAAIGRSDPLVPQGLCRLRVSGVKMLSFGGGGGAGVLLGSALEACDQALRIDPENLEALRTRSNLFWRMAEREDNEGQDPRPSIAQAVATGREVLRLRPADVDTRYNVAVAISIRGSYEARRGIDPRSSFDEAMGLLEQTVATDRNYHKAYREIGHIEAKRSEYAVRHGLDPVPAWRRGEEAIRHALAANPGYDIGYLTVVRMLLSEAEYGLERGRDPEPIATKAMALADEGLAASPRSPSLFYERGRIDEARALWRWLRGDDPEASVESARQAFDKAIALRPSYGDARIGIARLQWILGRRALERRESPLTAIADGRRWLEEARKGEPGRPPDYVIEVRLALLEALWRQARGVRADEALARAQAAAETIAAYDVEDVPAYLALAEAHWRRALGLRGAGAAAAAEIARGLAACEKALALDPRRPRALALRGALQLVQNGEAKAGGTSLETVLAGDGLLAREYGGR